MAMDLPKVTLDPNEASYETPQPRRMQTTHYALSLRIDELVRWSHNTLEQLERELRGVSPIFCYRGFSGVGHATALAIKWHVTTSQPFGMIYIRKSGEQAHSGCDEEHSLNIVERERTMLVFVDDHISSGHTLRKTLSQAFPIAYHRCPRLDDRCYITATSCVRRETGLLSFVRENPRSTMDVGLSPREWMTNPQQMKLTPPAPTAVEDFLRGRFRSSVGLDFNPGQIAEGPKEFFEKFVACNPSPNRKKKKARKK